MAQVVLENVILKHDIPVKTQYGVTHVLIFYDPKTSITWAWKTSTLSPFETHCSYSIMGRDEGNYNLSHVTQISHDRLTEDETMKSEQKKPNALDILIPDTHLTNDEKYNIIIEGGAVKCLKKL